MDDCGYIERMLAEQGDPRLTTFALCTPIARDESTSVVSPSDPKRAAEEDDGSGSRAKRSRIEEHATEQAPPQRTDQEGDTMMNELNQILCLHRCDLTDREVRQRIVEKVQSKQYIMTVVNEAVVKQVING